MAGGARGGGGEEGGGAMAEAEEIEGGAARAQPDHQEGGDEGGEAELGGDGSGESGREEASASEDEGLPGLPGASASEDSSGEEDGSSEEEEEDSSGDESESESESHEVGSASGETSGSGEETDEEGSAEESAGEVELTVDMNHRAAWGCGQGVCFDQRVFPNALEPDEGLYRDCELAFNARSVKSGAYSSGKTFFIRASETPRCRLEAMALEIFWYHAQSSGCNPFLSGAEWWTQVVDRDDDIGWHWDKDYSMEDCGVHLCPHLGTVTYLTDFGAPTFVLEKVPSSVAKQRRGYSTEILEAFVSWPSVGKHMVFDGRFLHGAPSDLQNHPVSQEGPQTANDPTGSVSYKGQKKRKLGSRKRTTFLVNIWLNHVPQGVKQAPTSVVERMTKDKNHNETVMRLMQSRPWPRTGDEVMTSGRSDEAKNMQPTPQKEATIGGDSFGSKKRDSDKYRWDFKHSGQKLTLELGLPDAVFRARSESPGALTLHFEPGHGALLHCGTNRIKNSAAIRLPG